MEEKYIVKQNQKKQLKLVFMALIMIIASTLLIVVDIEIRGTIVISKVIGVIGFVFFGACGIYIFSRFLKPKDILVLHKEGIVDSSSAVSLGLIKWEYIKGYGIVQVLSQKFIGITTKDVEERIEKLPVVKKKLMQTNMFMGYPAVSINLNAALESHEEVLDKIDQYYQRYHNKKNDKTK